MDYENRRRLRTTDIFGCIPTIARKIPVICIMVAEVSMVIQEVGIKRVVMVRLNPGDDILEGIRSACEQAGVANGTILNGLGSTEAHHYHVVASNELPPREAFPRAEAPRDIVAFSGLIIGGRVHAHITLSDDKRAEGGHLEPGTKALTFAIIAIADMGDADFSDWDGLKDL